MGMVTANTTTKKYIYLCIYLETRKEKKKKLETREWKKYREVKKYICIYVHVCIYVSAIVCRHHGFIYNPLVNTRFYFSFFYPLLNITTLIFILQSHKRLWNENKYLNIVIIYIYVWKNMWKKFLMYFFLLFICWKIKKKFFFFRYSNVTGDCKLIE